MRAALPAWCSVPGCSAWRWQPRRCRSTAGDGTTASVLPRSATPRLRREAPLVIDLCALWAGPLCGQLLVQAGARVIKVESVSRLDGARGGPPEFYDLLNAGKESVVVDLSSADDRARLLALLLKADIVLESARPRGLEQLGIRAAEIVASRPGISWVSITGYGRQAPMRDWIAYGDDAGVAAGLGWLLRRDGARSVFCGDAIADPLTGLHAALLAYASWLDGGGRLLDISLHGVAAYGASLHDTTHAAAGQAAQPPQARAVSARAATPGRRYRTRVARILLSGAWTLARSQIPRCRLREAGS